MNLTHVRPLALVTLLLVAPADALPALTRSAGDLRLTLSAQESGLRLDGLRDDREGQELLAPDPRPLFVLTLRHAATRREVRLSADEGWQRPVLRASRGGLEARWERPRDQELRGLSVTARARADAAGHAWRWTLRVDNASSEWSVWRVVFPQVVLRDLGDGAAVLLPRGPGEEQQNPWGRNFKYRGNYPGGWCSMQFTAAYRRGERPTGLYCAVHDPWGSTKDILVESDSTQRTVRLAFDHPAPDMSVAGNRFVLEGAAVWQLLRGDWFDAARIYRAWARREARWWPRLTAEGRADTPRWMRELNAWAMAGGAPTECVTPVKQFQEYLGVPTGFHWYNWHQIPFDNDYPHYFPARTNFGESVRDLQRAGVFVMPYINGRLWDALDRGSADFEFSARARPAATKNENGQPYLESYGSKETNGEPVRLAAMCPATPLWQQTVRDIVLRLLREAGTRGVYVDQVAAAAPTLCMDRAHGHPLGGGHWWNEGYWRMLEDIRRAMPRDTVLTTECNGEPFIRWFDGYLTWHWQYDGQVPAFPAVYGGAVQMFGRAFRGGPTKDLALRMKAAQQLVFGEQPGWIDPGVIKEPENAEFFRQMVRWRGRFSRYFQAGEMARPPRLSGNVPTAKADWQWSGEWWVTFDSAVVTGAWHLPRERRMLLLFVNVSDAPVTATVRCQPAVRSKSFQAVVRHGAEKGTETVTLSNPIERPATFPPRQAQAWELRF